MTINIDDLKRRKVEGGALLPVVGFVQLVSETASGETEPLTLLTDDKIGALVTIDAAHYKIHKGDTYIVSYKTPDASPLADNATIIFVLTIGTKEAHPIFDGACGGDFELELWENPSITDGTVTTPENRNRTKENNATVTVVRDPTVDSDGPRRLEVGFGPGGTGPQASGSISGQRDEWVLNPGSKYMFRLTNRAGNNQPASLRVEWYEED